MKAIKLLKELKHCEEQHIFFNPHHHGFVLDDINQALSELAKQPDYEKENERLKEENKALKVKLGKRSNHNRDCRRYKYGDNYECTCGYDKP